jgi:hypothetical protein
MASSITVVAPLPHHLGLAMGLKVQVSLRGPIRPLIECDLEGGNTTTLSSKGRYCKGVRHVDHWGFARGEMGLDMPPT